MGEPNEMLTKPFHFNKFLYITWTKGVFFCVTIATVIFFTHEDNYVIFMRKDIGKSSSSILLVFIL